MDKTDRQGHLSNLILSRCKQPLEDNYLKHCPALGRIGGLSNFSNSQEYHWKDWCIASSTSPYVGAIIFYPEGGRLFVGVTRTFWGGQEVETDCLQFVKIIIKQMSAPPTSQD